MRVTQGLLFQQALDGVQRHSESIALRQVQIATGRRWMRPSEDPVAASQSMGLRSRGDVLERFTQSAIQAQDRLNASASALQSMSDLLGEAKEIATNAVNPTLTATDRKALATKLDNILGQVLEAANRRDAFGFLFSGTAAATPYVQTGQGIEYHGNDGTQQIAAGDAYFIGTNIPGSQIFEREQRVKTLYFGSGTGVKAGTGTDSAKDRGSLAVYHGATTIGDGTLGGGDSASGVKLGASSATKDTVLGLTGTHTLTIDDVNKTIQLNNGAAVTFTGSETDLAVVDGTGAVVHVDLTSLTGGFSGTVSIAASGFLSTDAGATKVAIDFSANQTVVHSANGATTNVNTSGVKHAGTEVVDYAGTSSLFQTLLGLRDDLVNYDSLPAETRDPSLLARGRELARNFENLLGSLAELGSRSNAAKTAESRYQELRDEMAKSLSNLEDADFAEVVVEYNKSQIALQLAQAAGSRLLQTNYLSFLQ